ncbi:MAG: hypothetical protein AMXMBFR58_25920 [Phycisphaerae bacterium]|nr:hypothetical protein [Phycisphaerales bacterium]
MKAVISSVAVLVALCGAASADMVSTGPGGMSGGKLGTSANGYLAISHTNVQRDSATITYTVVGGDIPAIDALFDPDNAVFATNTAVDLGLPSGTPVTMTAVGWDVTLTTFGFSWLSDMTVYWDDNITPDGFGLFVTPGFADIGGGTNVFRSSGGMIDLSDNAIPDILMPDGVMRWEFFDTFQDDVDGVPEGVWVQGSQFHFTFEYVPAPGSLALVGLAGLAAGRRRR